MTVEGQRSRQPKPLAAGAFQGTICSFRLHLAAEGKSAKTVRMYAEAVQWFAAAHLLRETSRTDWGQVCAQDVQCWMVWLLGRYSDSYASNQYRALQQFFRWWSDEEELPDPKARLRPPRVSQKLVPVFTSGELSTLERACQGRTFAQRRDCAIIAVFKGPASGCRNWQGSDMTRMNRCAVTLTCGVGRSWSVARAARRGSSGSAMRPPAVSTGISGFAPGMSRRTGRRCGWE
jgi:integrase/recombinase XerD